MRGVTEGAVLDAKIDKVLRRIENRGIANDQCRPEGMTFMSAAIEGAEKMNADMSAILCSLQEGTND